MGEFTHEKSRTKSIYLELEKMKVGQQIDKTELILRYWDYHDYFVDRSFSVLFVKCKKMMPERKFITVGKKITRIL